MYLGKPTTEVYSWRVPKHIGLQKLRKVLQQRHTIMPHLIHHKYLVYLTMTFFDPFIFSMSIYKRQKWETSSKFSDMSKVTQSSGARDGARFHKSDTDWPRRTRAEITDLLTLLLDPVFLHIPNDIFPHCF